MHVHFKKTLLFEKERLSLKELRVALNSKELNERFDVKKSNSGNGLVTKGRSSNRENGRKFRGRSKSKTHDGKVVSSFICYHRKKKGQTRKYFPLRKKGENNDKPFKFDW